MCGDSGGETEWWPNAPARLLPTPTAHRPLRNIWYDAGSGYTRRPVDPEEGPGAHAEGMVAGLEPPPAHEGSQPHSIEARGVG